MLVLGPEPAKAAGDWDQDRPSRNSCAVLLTLSSDALAAGCEGSRPTRTSAVAATAEAPGSALEAGRCSTSNGIASDC